MSRKQAFQLLTKGIEAESSLYLMELLKFQCTLRPTHTHTPLSTGIPGVFTGKTECFLQSITGKIWGSTGEKVSMKAQSLWTLANCHSLGGFTTFGIATCPRRGWDRLKAQNDWESRLLRTCGRWDESMRSRCYLQRSRGGLTKLHENSFAFLTTIKNTSMVNLL